MRGNIDGLASFRSLIRKILMDSLLDNLYLLGIQLEREDFDRLLAKHPIHQYFPQQNFVLYSITMYLFYM